MAYDAFLKLDGIDGEVAAKGFEKWIEVSSFSWGVSQTGAVSGGGGGAGKASFQDIHFTSNTSKASPKLFLSCASGQHIKQATLSLRKAGGDATGAQNVFLKFEFEDVLISSFQEAGAEQGDDSPMEDVSFNFAKIEMTYTAPDGEVVQAGWDLGTNKGG